MKKRFKGLSIILVLILVVSISLAACTPADDDSKSPDNVEDNNEVVDEGTDEEPEDDFHLVLKLSHVFAPEQQLTLTLDGIAERILERTDGAIEIQTFGGGQLATYKDGLEQVVRGADFISAEDPSYLGDYVPDFNALVGPMLYTSMDQYSQMIETELVKDMIAKAEEKGIKVLNLDFMGGFRNLNTNKVIEKPEDLKGMKIRVPMSELFIDTMNAMGATASSLPFSETISGVQQGVVDGLEGTEESFIMNNLEEIVENVAFTKHFLGTVGSYISIDVWNSIPEKYQVIIEEEIRIGADEMNAIAKASEEEMIKELEGKGIKFNEVDSKAFKEATAKVYDNMKGVSPGIYEKLMEELDKMD